MSHTSPIQDYTQLPLLTEAEFAALGHRWKARGPGWQICACGAWCPSDGRHARKGCSCRLCQPCPQRTAEAVPCPS
jgi:hypothetical protein